MGPEKRRGFTLVEILVALGLGLAVLALVATLARSFLVGFIWGEGTFTGVGRAALLHATLRRDLTRTRLDGATPTLGLRTAPGRLTIEWPADGATAGTSVEYHLDGAREALVRTVDGQGPQVLGAGQVLGFEARPVAWVVSPEGAGRWSGGPGPGERPVRLGVALHFRLRTSDLSSAGGTARALDFTTHVFPPFANRRLTSVWKRKSP